MVARLSINLPDDINREIADYARRKGASKTEAVKRAWSVLRYVEAAQERGAEMAVVENGETKRVHFT
jgi:hypothetical protein